MHFALSAFLHVLLQLVDFRALPPNNDSRASGIDPHDQLIGSAFDIDGADARALQFIFQLAAQIHVFMKELGVVAVGIPARLPRFVVAQAKSVRVCLLSHSYPLRATAEAADLLLAFLRMRALLSGQSFAN